MLKFNFSSLVYFLVVVLLCSSIIGCPRGGGGGGGEGDGEPAVEGEGESGGELGDMETIMLPGDVPLEIVWCPSGMFMMGSETGDPDESPMHEVTLTQGFWMGKYEVTQAQWVAVMDSNPSNFTGDNRPVEDVSWNDAQSFISALNAATYKTFRLPTEAEWEYACRAGTTTAYNFDDSLGSLGDYAWYGDNSGLETHDVGGKLPNAWGLYDMHGNVWEWCQDWFDSSYYSDSPSADPAGPESGSYRLLRGGSWSSSNNSCRSAFRNNNLPESIRHVDGFRIARTP